MFRLTPVPSSSPARWVSLGNDVDSPAEVLRAPRRRSHPEVERRAGPQPARQPAERLVDHRRAGGPLILEARPRHARRDQQLVGGAGAVGGHQHHLLVDGHDPLAGADLLLHEIGQQVAAHRPRGVGAEALALAGEGRGHEVERVELRVAVGKRGPRVLALVDDQVHAGRVGVNAHALAPHLDGPCHLLHGQLGQRHHGVRGVDDHLVRAERRRRPEQVAGGIGAGAGLGTLGLVRAGRGQRRVEVRHHAHRPTRGVGSAAVRAQRVDLGRRAVLVAFRKRVRSRIQCRRGRHGELTAGAPGAGAGHDRAVPAQGVDAQLRVAAPRFRPLVDQRTLSIATCSMPASMNILPRAR